MPPHDGTRDAVLLLVVLGLVAFVGLWGIGAAASDIGTETKVSSEVNQTTSNGYVSVGGPDDADRYGAATVTNDTRELQRNVGYFFNQSDGTIQFNETINSPAQNWEYENATVNVTAVELPGQSATILPILEPLLELPAYIVLIAGAAAMLIGLREFRKSAQRGGGPV